MEKIPENLQNFTEKIQKSTERRFDSVRRCGKLRCVMIDEDDVNRNQSGNKKEPRFDVESLTEAR